MGTTLPAQPAPSAAPTLSHLVFVAFAVVAAAGLAHGASAFYASGFERAAVISVDNNGDMTSAALMTGDGSELHVQAEAQFPNSIGMVYSAATAALGALP